MGLLSLLNPFRGVKPLELGTAAPVIRTQDHDGTDVDLGEACRKGFVLVYFYPKADTPGCTAQACSIRDGFADLVAKGVTVFGVSADAPDAQKKFREKFHLPFTLIADPDGRVIRAFGVPTIPFVGLASRQAFLFRDGILVWRDLHASTNDQAADVLRILGMSGGRA